MVLLLQGRLKTSENDTKFLQQWFEENPIEYEDLLSDTKSKVVYSYFLETMSYRYNGEKMSEGGSHEISAGSENFDYTWLALFDCLLKFFFCRSTK